jgi:hypothetical protein
VPKHWNCNRIRNRYVAPLIIFIPENLTPITIAAFVLKTTYKVDNSQFLVILFEAEVEKLRF